VAGAFALPPGTRPSPECADRAPFSLYSASVQVLADNLIATQGSAILKDKSFIMRVMNCCSSQRIWAALVAMAMTVVLQPVAIAAPDSAAERQEEELDEVIVKGNHLWQIRKAISDTEERFYARFNELNSDNDFDIHCPRFPRRRCLPAFYMDALMEEANHMIEALAVGGYDSSLSGYAQVIWLERLDEYRQNALAVINNDRQLRVLIHQREALNKKLNERRREIFKDRWISW
jgi:hypothetical protein